MRPRPISTSTYGSRGRISTSMGVLANVAASALLKDGVLTSDLVDTALYGGRLGGKLRLAHVSAGLGISTRAKLIGADFGAAVGRFRPVRRHGKGRRRDHARGRGAFAGRGHRRPQRQGVAGALRRRRRGVNLEEALRRSQRRPLDVAKDMRIGETAFDTFALEFAFGHGIAHVVNGELGAQGVAANLQGQVDLPAQSWDLHANAIQTDAAGQPSKDGARLSFNRWTVDVADDPRDGRRG